MPFLHGGLLLILAIAVAHDLRTREIPDWVSLAVAALGLVGAAGGWLPLSGWQMLGGAVLGFALTAPLFYLGGIGGADVKLLTALGLVSGPWGLLTILFWMALAGGVLALVAKLRKQNDFAYGPAIFLGFAAYAVGLWRQ